MLQFDDELFFQMENNLEKRANKPGALVRLMRETAEMSQEELAESLYITASTVSKIENNKLVMKIDTFREIIRITKCGELAIVYLFGLDGIKILDNIKNKINSKTKSVK